MAVAVAGVFSWVPEEVLGKSREKMCKMFPRITECFESEFWCQQRHTCPEPGVETAPNMASTLCEGCFVKDSITAPRPLQSASFVHTVSGEDKDRKSQLGSSHWSHCCCGHCDGNTQGRPALHERSGQERSSACTWETWFLGDLQRPSPHRYAQASPYFK